MSGRHRNRATPARPGRVLRAGVAVLAVSMLLLSQAPLANGSPASLQQREWWLGALGLTKVWSITKGAGVTVAVVDSGVDATVGDLQGALVPGFTVSGSSGSPDTEHESSGHGTRMAVVIAGRGTDPGIIGVAPQAKIMPIYMPDSDADVASILNRLIAMPSPPQIVNMSFGAAGSCPSDIQAAVATAVAKGLILVSSAGNEGSTTNDSEYPSNCTGVIAVGAFGPDGTAWTDTQRQPYVSLGGPGVDMVAYDRAHTIGTANGTSDAAAIVSGEFALLRAKFPAMPSRQLVARMFATASKSLYHGPGYGQPGSTLGFGPALVHQALIKTVPASAPNPVYDELARLQTPPASGPPASEGQSSPPFRPTGSVEVSFPGGGTHATGSGSSSGPLIGVVAVLGVLLALVVGLLLYRRRRAAHTGAGIPGSGSWP